MDRFEVSRRAFVAGAATVAALGAPAVAAAADPLVAPPSAPGTFDTVPYAFDVAAFAAVLDRPFAHRQVVAAQTFVQAKTALAFMRNSIEAYLSPKGFNAGPGAFHAAAVFYHGSSVFLPLDDAMFAKYPLGQLIAEQSGAKAGDPPIGATNPAGDGVRALVTHHGASFFVCNNALSGQAGDIAKRVAAPGTAVTRAQVVAIHDDLVAHFLPGTLLVPAGVAAINAAQEARFTFLSA